ncbi:phosphotransferase family protein [Streptomyces sp. NBC_01077]|uniref:phosphotransferase family protein n=1 Tax=Streptomyces sp. NBC_01077 TaxID=2903746 RepID=UPI00386EF798
MPEVGTSAIHGDAWPGNLVRTPGGPLLMDLGRFSLGPADWDLVSTAVRWRTTGAVTTTEYRRFCEIYGRDVTARPTTVCLPGPENYGWSPTRLSTQRPMPNGPRRLSAAWTAFAAVRVLAVLAPGTGRASSSHLSQEFCSDMRRGGRRSRLRSWSRWRAWAGVPGCLAALAVLAAILAVGGFR